MARGRSLPIVYACSGCSSAAQMANHIAICLDRAGLAEMSCIAGVGGDVPSLVKVAMSGRPIVAIDGCKLHCAKSCLARHGVEPERHHTLTDFSIKKRFHMDFDGSEAKRMFDHVSARLPTRPLSGAGGDSMERPQGIEFG